MARPQKEGLDYFPLDVDMDQDDKVELIEAQHGLIGFGVVVRLLMKIYKNGYYYGWTEKEQLLFLSRVNVDINQVNDIINDCLKWGLFDKRLFEAEKVLTSRGIQRRYMKATERRQNVQIQERYLLLEKKEVNAYKNIVIVDINHCSSNDNANINPQSKVKNSKEKNSREENTLTTPTDADEIQEQESIKSDESLTVETAGTTAGKEAREQSSKTLIEKRFDEFWAAYPKKVGKKAALNSWKKLKPNAELHDRIMTAIGRARVTEQWQKENGRYIPNPTTWINQGRWDDEYEERVTNGVNSQYSSGNKQQPTAPAQGASGKQDALAGFKTIDDYDFYK